MAVGKISGGLLKDDLLREGVDLAFETDLLYLDVNNRRIGIKTSTPTDDLTVNGTTRTTDLEVNNVISVGDLTFTNNEISTTNPVLQLTSTSGGVVYQGKLTIDDIRLEGNQISTINSNADLELSANGTGEVKINFKTTVIVT